MKKQLIIGLVGLSDSGKGTVVDILDLSNLLYQELAFGNAVKDGCVSLFDTSYALFHDKRFREIPSNVLGGKTPRQVLQDVGDAVRAIVEDAWVIPVKNELENTIYYNDSQSGAIVVSDVRRENELQMLLNLAIKHSNTVIVELWDIERDVIPHKHQDYIRQLFEFYKNDLIAIKPQVEQLLIGNNLPVKYAHNSELNYWILKRLCNRHIDNNGDLEQLHSKIAVILDEINKYNT
jgi:hypothetical protein